MLSFFEPDAVTFRDRIRQWVPTAIPDGWDPTTETTDEAAANKARLAWERTLWDAGYAGISWPTEYGGVGLGPIEQAIFYEEVALAHAPSELNVIGKFLAGPALINSGTPEQRSRFLPRILSAEEIWCEGFSEPNAGSDLAAAATTATWDGECYRISGQKTWTSRADLADRCYLLARTDPTGPRYRNLSVFLFNMNQPGVTVRPMRQITGNSPFSEVFFDDAVATPDELLGERNHGWELSTLNGFRRQRQVTDGLRRYVELREWCDQLTVCVAENRRGTERLEEIVTRLNLLRWHLYRTSELIARDENWLPASSVVKVYWSELMQAIAEFGQNLRCAAHEEYWRYRYFYSRAATIYGGTAQIQRNVIASSVLGLPSSK